MRKHFWEIITRLSRERGLTFLVTTHHLVEAEFCHRLALMNQGRVVALGTPQNLREQVLKEKGEIMELWAQPQRKALKALKALGLQAYPMGRLLRLWSKGVNMERLVKDLEQERVKVEVRGTAQVSMEDVFIHFMEKGQRVKEGVEA